MANSERTVVDGLWEDLQQLTALLQERGPNAFLIRVYVRTIFSVFDGYSYYLKQNAARRASTEGVALTKGDLEMIYERRGDDPATGGKPKTIGTADNLRFAVRLWARVNNGEAPPRNGELPPEFERIRVLRNRITHPKQVDDFNVTAEDVKAVAGLFEWFREITDWNGRLELAYIDTVRARIKNDNNELRARILAAGPVDDTRKMSVEEMYTPPRLKKHE